MSTELETKLSQILEEKQNKIIPENIKKGVQIFDVIGTYEGNKQSTIGVKLFETQEEMQQDPNANEGDLAVVYREEIQNMTADTQTQFLTFPETVILPQALTESYYCRLRATNPSKMFDGNIQLSKTSFRLDGYSESGMIRVQYSSGDGITYTRTRFSSDSGDLTNPVDLGTEIHCEMQEEWNDNFGHFMQIGGSTFEGLYEYSLYIDKENVYSILISDMSFDYNSTDGITNMAWNGNKYSILNIPSIIELYNKIKEDTELDLMYVAIDENDNLILFDLKNYNYMCGDIAFDPNKNQLGICSPNERDYDFILSVATLDLESKSYAIQDYNISGNVYVNVYKYNWSYFPIKLKTLTYKINSSNNKITCNNYFVVGDTTAGDREVYIGNSPLIPESLNGLYVEEYKYQLAPTQLNLTASNELLPGKIGYGKEGIAIGDDTLYDNLDLVKILTSFMNVPEEVAIYSESQIRNTMYDKGTVVEDNCIWYCNYGEFTKGKMHHILPYNSTFENILYMSSDYAEGEIATLAKKYRSFAVIYNPYYDNTLIIGYYTTSVETAASQVEIIVYKDEQVQAHYTTPQTYTWLEGRLTFYYNNNIYIIRDPNDVTTVYRLNEDLSLTAISSPITGECYNIALDEVTGILYANIGNTYARGTVKAINLSDGSVSTVDNNTCAGIFASKNYICYILDGIRKLKWKRKGNTSFTEVDTNINIDTGNSGLNLGENEDGSKVAIVANSSTSFEGGIGVLTPNTNEFVTYTSDGYNAGGIFDIDKAVYLKDDIVYIYYRGDIIAVDSSGIFKTIIPYNKSIIGSSDYHGYQLSVDENNNIIVKSTYISPYSTPVTANYKKIHYIPKTFIEGGSNSYTNFFAKDKNTMFIIGDFKI